MSPFNSEQVRVETRISRIRNEGPPDPRLRLFDVSSILSLRNGQGTVYEVGNATACYLPFIDLPTYQNSSRDSEYPIRIRKQLSRHSVDALDLLKNSYTDHSDMVFSWLGVTDINLDADAYPRAYECGILDPENDGEGDDLIYTLMSEMILPFVHCSMLCVIRPQPVDKELWMRYGFIEYTESHSYLQHNCSRKWLDGSWAREHNIVV